MSTWSPPISKESLEALYWGEGKTAEQIGDMVGRSGCTVTRWMKTLGVAVRGKEESNRLAVARRTRCAPCRVALKSELTCRKCGAFWLHTSAKGHTRCPYCGAYKDARHRPGQGGPKSQTAADRKEVLKKWYGVRENRLERGRRSRAVLRKRVFFRVSGTIHPSCVRCGCDDVRLLEVNHKNGGGAKEIRSTGGMRFYYDVASGKRGTQDLELLCKPCNAIHYLELRFGELPMRVVWSSLTRQKSE